MECDYYKSLSITELIKHRDNCQKQIDDTISKLKEYTDICFISSRRPINTEALDAYKDECFSLINNQYQILTTLCNKLIDERNSYLTVNTSIT